jgi:hypothetical protein
VTFSKSTQNPKNRIRKAGHRISHPEKKDHNNNGMLERRDEKVMVPTSIAEEAIELAMRLQGDKLLSELREITNVESSDATLNAFEELKMPNQEVSVNIGEIQQVLADCGINLELQPIIDELLKKASAKDAIKNAADMARAELGLPFDASVDELKKAQTKFIEESAISSFIQSLDLHHEAIKFMTGQATNILGKEHELGNYPRFDCTSIKLADSDYWPTWLMSSQVFKNSKGESNNNREPFDTKPSKRT